MHTRRMSAAARKRCILSAVLAVALAGASAELLQVQVVHRHGARPHLVKNGSRPGFESGGAQLLGAGVEQLSALGAAIRRRYYGASGAEDASPIEGVSSTYGDESDAISFSSDLARTQSSARAFLQGLYPEAADHARVPIRVFDVEERDWVLRSYLRCPAFTSNVQSFLDGDTYAAKAKEVRDTGVLAPAARGIGEEEDLSHAFNTYDRYALSRGDYAVEDKIPALSDERFKAVKDAADWMESKKFGGTTVASSFVGGALLSQLLEHSRILVSSDGTENANIGKHRLVEYSGHYPLVLGILAALGLSPDVFDADSLGRVVTSSIPDFGAAVVWEFHSGGSEDEVRLLWWGGAANDTFEPLPCGTDGKALSCSLASLEERASSIGLMSSRSEFCRRCGVDDGANGALCRDTLDLAKSDEDSGNRPLLGVLACVSGIAIGLVTSCVYFRLFLPRAEKRRSQMATIEVIGGYQESVDGNGEILHTPERHVGP